MPTFLQLCQLLYFLGTLLSHSFGTRLHLFIQHLLMNTVRAAIAFPVPVVAPADVFHTAAAIPVTDHGTEHVPAFLTGQQPSVG